LVTRRQVLTGLGLGAFAIAGAGGYKLYKRLYPDPARIGFRLSKSELKAGKDFLKTWPSFDVHTHAGRTFVAGAQNLKPLLWIYAKAGTFEERAIADMKAGGLSAASFSAVSDFPVLNTGEKGLSAVREFKPGEAWRYMQTQLANLEKLVESALVMQVRNPDDVLRAHKTGKPGAMFASEGADFIEGRLERVKAVYDRGVRMITIMHYHNNELGDIMTGPPVLGGLSDVGAKVVGKMNRLGMMIDISHASEKTAFGILEKSTKPVLATHTHIQNMGLAGKKGLHHPRFISRELAQGLFKRGGVIGAWPAGFDLETLAEFVERIEQLVAFAGIDHVVIGSDMDANYRPVYDTFKNLPLIVGQLLKRGMKEADVAKLVGGNFLRVFKENAG
jgi:membrane dipeptidase